MLIDSKLFINLLRRCFKFYLLFLVDSGGNEE